MVKQALVFARPTEKEQTSEVTISRIKQLQTTNKLSMQHHAVVHVQALVVIVVCSCKLEKKRRLRLKGFLLTSLYYCYHQKATTTPYLSIWRNFIIVVIILSILSTLLDASAKKNVGLIILMQQERISTNDCFDVLANATHFTSSCKEVYLQTLSNKKFIPQEYSSKHGFIYRPHQCCSSTCFSFISQGF